MRPFALLTLLVAATAAPLRAPSALGVEPPPPAATGPDVLLLLHAAATIPASEYKCLLGRLQGNTTMRLWTAALDHTLVGFPAAAAAAVAEAEELGFEGPVVLAGHSNGATAPADAAAEGAFAGLVLLGAHLLGPRHDLREFAVPVLTLGAELDGATRVTRLMVEVEKHLELDDAADPVRTKPVGLLRGASGSQFSCGGRLPGDLAAEIDDDVAHTWVAEVVAAFLMAQLAPETATGVAGEERLAEEVRQAAQLSRPFLDARVRDMGPWCEVTQRVVANLEAADEDRLQTEVELYYDIETFGPSKASMEVDDDGVGNVLVSSWATYLDDGSDLGIASAAQLSCKVKSQDEVTDRLDVTPAGLQGRCQTANELALSVALAEVDSTVRARYEEQGSALTFLPDDEKITGGDWLPTPFVIERCLVQSPALEAPYPFFDPVLQGAFYCHQLSPSRAVEWVIIESLLQRSC